MKQIRRFFPSIVIVILFVSVQSGLAQKGIIKIDHTVTLADVAKQEFHITTDIRNIDQPQLDLSLPTWTPGWYTVENYFKNVLRFRITDGNGKVLPLRMSRKQTWNVDTRGIKQIRIDYDYRATVLGLNQAKIATDFAFFTGIELFLEPHGHRNNPSAVKFQLPTGWKLITALKETPDPMIFTAADYDTLVDAPVLMGSFDVTQFEVEGKPHYFAAVPAGVFNAEKSKKFTEMWGQTIKAQSAIFGGLPYEKYVAFYFFMPAQSNASGALEHLNSYVAFSPGGERSAPEGIIDTGSHEFFHLWNVKRIRPAEMWPYDYSRENETPLLWVSEGFTNYYGLVGTYRGGVTSKESFLQRAADAAAGIENNEARNYISPANSSVSTWAGYDTPVAFGISYYTQGQNLACLLDLSIRNDTDGRSSLDDVMRALYNDHYKKGRGYTIANMIDIINRLTKKDYNDFYNRYVFGTDVPDYDKIFGYAGFKLEKTAAAQVDPGFGGRYRNGGLAVAGVDPTSPAAAAGVRVGDIITKINGQPVIGFRMVDEMGKSAKFTITRGSTEMELTFVIGSRSFTNYSLAALPTSSAKQTRIREGWLKR